MWAVGPPEPNPPDLVAELGMRGPTQNVTGSEIGLYITFELQIQRVFWNRDLKKSPRDFLVFRSIK